MYIDGAAKDQMATTLLEQHFLRCLVTVGLEHTVSLLFRLIGEICQLDKLVSSCVAHFLSMIDSVLYLFKCSEMYVNEPVCIPCSLKKISRLAVSLQNAGWKGRCCSCRGFFV